MLFTKFNKIISYVIIAAMALCFITGCSSKRTPAVATPEERVTQAHVTPAATPETEPQTEPETIAPVTITLSAVGDMLMHTSASNPAIQADGSYNYDYLLPMSKMPLRLQMYQLLTTRLLWPVTIKVI